MKKVVENIFSQHNLVFVGLGRLWGYDVRSSVSILIIKCLPTQRRVEIAQNRKHHIEKKAGDCSDIFFFLLSTGARPS